jgi:hypothetical protein
MGRLLTDTDYLRVIQDANLQQIIEENTQILKDMEQAAQSEMTSYLKQRYDTDRIFYGTDSASPFNLSAVYKGLNLVQYSEAAYSALTTYTTGQRVVYQNLIVMTYSAILKQINKTKAIPNFKSILTLGSSLFVSCKRIFNA